MAKVINKDAVAVEAEEEIIDIEEEMNELPAYDAKPKDIPVERPTREAATDINAIVSPLVSKDVTDGLRPRVGWHQTWKRGDEFREAIEFGYRQIRKPLIGKHQAPGMETGEVLKRPDGEKGAIIAMEIPEWVYLDHLSAIAVKSHRSYNDPATVLRNFENGTNRDLSSRKEQVSMSVSIEGQREDLH